MIHNQKGPIILRATHIPSGTLYWFEDWSFGQIEGASRPPTPGSHRACFEDVGLGVG